MSIQTRSMDNPHVAANVAEMKKSRKSKAEIDSYLASNYSDSEIKATLLDWIKSPKSDAWSKEKLIDLMEYRKELTDARWSDITDGIFEEVHRYLPMEGPSGESMSFLRQALVDGKFDDTYSARIPAGYREAVYVNAEYREVKLTTVYKNMVGNLFHYACNHARRLPCASPILQCCLQGRGRTSSQSVLKAGCRRSNTYQRNPERCTCSST